MGKVTIIVVPEDKNTMRYKTVSEWKKLDHMDIQDIEQKYETQFHVHDVEGIFQSLPTGDMFKQVTFRKPLDDLQKEVTDIRYLSFNSYFNSYFNVVYKSRTTRCFMFDIQDAALILNLKILQDMVAEQGDNAHPKFVKNVENMTIQCLQLLGSDILPTPRIHEHEEEPIAHTSDLPDLV